jgi:hypothetical protein
VILSGSAELTVAGERAQMQTGAIARVEPQARRNLVPGADGVRILAIGCAPSGSYERPQAFRVAASA